jgi:hypothetical protein
VEEARTLSTLINDLGLTQTALASGSVNDGLNWPDCDGAKRRSWFGHRTALAAARKRTAHHPARRNARTRLFDTTRRSKARTSLELENSTLLSKSSAGRFQTNVSRGRG